jgi:hypothetical protein
MTLDDILQSAQGGQAVDNLAHEFGVTPEAAKAAVHAMIPAFSTGLRSTAADPAAIAAVLKELASGAHVASFADPGHLAGASGLDANVLGQVFGSRQAIDEVVRHVSQVSSVDPDTIQRMLPVVGSMLLGGLAHAMANRGLSGVLSELANAATAPGGLGSAAGPAGGSSGGLLRSIIGAAFGGSHEAANPQTAALATGFAALSAMFVSGAQVAQADQGGANAMAQPFTPPPPGAGV